MYINLKIINIVRVQDRLTIFQLIRFGAFSSITSRGLLYIQSHRFIAILPLILVSATQAPLASLPERSHWSH